MAFNPKPEYQILSKGIDLKKFDLYRDKYITRPPYQRKNVWKQKKKQSLLDSFFRRYYVPKLVVREVRLSDERSVDEIIDGQQRITTLQEFFAGEIKLPKSLSDLSDDLPGKYYKQLSPEIREYFDELQIDTDRILNIEDPTNPEHQAVATEIFWRLQQGESLNKMEVAHARLSSRVRNFLVKYSDDITFDYDKYTPIDENRSKHKFFQILNRSNNRMEHLAMLARMLLIEIADGPTELKDSAIISLIDENTSANGIGNHEYENEPAAKATLANLTMYHSIFIDDPMIAEGGKVKELNKEYFVLSFYMLIKHIKKFYVVDEQTKIELHEFFILFHKRWREVTLDDRDMTEFSDSRQQGANDIRTREIIIRQIFFDYLENKSVELKAKDSQRAFSEKQRISLYRSQNGLCQSCKADGKSDKESMVDWSEYEADHVLPHSAGGETELHNAQLLCRYHNRTKGAKIEPTK